MKAKTLFSAFFIGFSTLLFGQSQATLRGEVVDKSCETVIGANITIFKDNIKKLTAVTDIDGKYSINIDRGTYDVKYSYLGLEEVVLKKVTFPGGQIVRIDVTMQEKPGEVESTGCSFIIYRGPLQDNTSAGFKLKENDIKRLPTRDISTMANMNQNMLWNY